MKDFTNVELFIVVGGLLAAVSILGVTVSFCSYEPRRSTKRNKITEYEFESTLHRKETENMPQTMIPDEAEESFYNGRRHFLNKSRKDFKNSVEVPSLTGSFMQRGHHKLFSNRTNRSSETNLGTLNSKITVESENHRRMRLQTDLEKFRVDSESTRADKTGEHASGSIDHKLLSIGEVDLLEKGLNKGMSTHGSIITMDSGRDENILVSVFEPNLARGSAVSATSTTAAVGVPVFQKQTKKATFESVKLPETKQGKKQKGDPNRSEEADFPSP